MSCTFDYLTRTTNNIAYNYFIVVIGFIVPVVVISGCYVGIVRSTFGQTREIIKQSLFGQPKKTFILSRSEAATKLLRARRRQEKHMAKVTYTNVFIFVRARNTNKY